MDFQALIKRHNTVSKGYDIYWDTSDYKLASRGMWLRVRETLDNHSAESPAEWKLSTSTTAIKDVDAIVSQLDGIINPTERGGLCTDKIIRYKELIPVAHYPYTRVKSKQIDLIRINEVTYIILETTRPKVVEYAYHRNRDLYNAIAHKDGEAARPVKNIPEEFAPPPYSDE